MRSPAIGDRKVTISPTRTSAAATGRVSTSVPIGAASPIDGVATVCQRPPVVHQNAAARRARATAAAAVAPAQLMFLRGLLADPGPAPSPDALCCNSSSRDAAAAARVGLT